MYLPEIEMDLPDKIIELLDGYGAVRSGITFFCNGSKSEEVAGFFEKNFSKYWKEAQDKLEEAWGSCEEKDAPAYVRVEDDCVYVGLGAICLYNNAGYIDFKYADEALEKALKTTRKKYPGISYEGVICFSWSDPKAGETVLYGISSDGGECDKSKVIADAFASVIDDDSFWDDDELRFVLEDGWAEELLEFFHAFENRIPNKAITRLLDLADKIDEDIRPGLEEIIEAWENGEEVKIGSDVDLSALPEGNMEALGTAEKEITAERNAKIEAELAAEDEVKIENGVLLDCDLHEVTEFAVPEGVTELNGHSFVNKLYVKKITLPDSLKVIGTCTFISFRELKSLNIPASVEEIDFGDFLNQSPFPRPLSLRSSDACSFQKITVDKKNPQYASLNGILYNKDKSALLFVPNRLSKTEIIIPKTVTRIPKEVFRHNYKIKKVNLPVGLETIEYAAFSDCTALEEINLSNVREIDSFAFDWCDKLASVDLCGEMTQIEMGVFRGCSALSHVVLPEKLTIIRRSAFKDCTSLAEITIPDSVCEIEQGAFDGCKKLTVHYRGKKYTQKNIADLYTNNEVDQV